MITQIFDFKVASFASVEEMSKEEVAIADIVEIRQHVPGGIYHSRSMIWRGNLSGVSDPLDFIRSKKERKVIQDNIAEFERMNMEVRVEPMTLERYEEFSTIYKQTTLSKERAIVYNLDEQIKSKIAVNTPIYLIGLFDKESVALLSGLVFSVNSKKEVLVSVGAKKKFEKLRGGIGGVFEYYLADFCLKNGLTEISHGKSENPTGVTTAAGIFEFKARYGFTAFPTEYWLTTFLLHPEKVAISDMIFITVGDNRLKYLVASKENPEIVAKKYLAREISDVEILNIEQLSQDHASAVSQLMAAPVSSQSE